MGDRLKKIYELVGDSPGDSIDELLSGANRILNLSSNLRLGKDSQFSKTLNYLGLATTIGWGLKSCYDFIQDFRDNSREIYTVRVSRGNPVYDIAQAIAMEEIRDEDKYTVAASTRWDNITEKPTLYTYFDSEMEQTVIIRGHSVIISTEVSVDDNNNRESASDSGSLMRKIRKKTTYKATDDLIITCFSLEAREDVLKELNSRISPESKKIPILHTAQSWGGFASTKMPKRPLESVILVDEQMDRITRHIQTFIDNETTYSTLGIPFHTGLMFYGPPGTGKTSITSILSAKFGLDVYQISLNSIDGDANLNELFTDIGENSIVIFEDIDISPSAVDRDSDERERVSMSGLLNVLDGNITPHGMIAILTTNHKDSLDPAVFRPGRVDLVEHFDYLDMDQLARTCLYFMGYVPNNLPEISKENKISPAEILGIFRMNILDIPSTEPELIKFLDNKILASVEENANV